MTQKLRIGVLGCAGRMGQLTMQEVLHDPDVELIGALVRPGSVYDNKDVGIILNQSPMDIVASADPATLFNDADCLIDFSHIDAVESHLKYAEQYRKPLLVAVTGLTDQHYVLAVKAAQHIPLIITANTSLGITLLIKLVEEAARKLPHTFDVDITETHHRHKKDAPSGTSLALGKAVQQGKSIAMPEHYHGRSINAARSETDINYTIIRAGGYPGDHSVVFSSMQEVIELKHRSLDRRVYAQGALYAAKWLARQQPGLYGMNDALS